MRVFIFILVEVTLRLVFALSAGYLITILLFPLAFESYVDGIYMTGMFAILVRLCLVPRNQR